VGERHESLALPLPQQFVEVNPSINASPNACDYDGAKKPAAASTDAKPAAASTDAKPAAAYFPFAASIDANPAAAFNHARKPSASTKLVNKDAFTSVSDWQDIHFREAKMSEYATVHPNIFSLPVCARVDRGELIEMDGLFVCEYKFYARKDDEKMKTDTIVEHPAGGGEDKYVVWEEDFLRRKKRCRRAYDKDGRKIKGGRKIEAGCFHVAFSCSLCDTLISIPGDVFEKVFRHIIKMKLTGFDRFDKEATDGVTIDDARLRNAVRIVRDTEGILDNQGGGVLNKYALAFPNCNRIGSHYLNHHRDQKRDWCAAANYSIDWWMYTTHHRLNKPGGEKEDPDDQEY